MVNKLILNMEDFTPNSEEQVELPPVEEVSSGELVDNAEEMVAQQQEIVSDINNVEMAQELQNNIEEQEKVLADENTEPTVAEVIDAEVKLENFSQFFTGHTISRVKKAYGMESFNSKQTNREMFKTNLQNKKMLLATVQEAIKDSKAGILSKISDFFTRGSKEYNKYLQEIDDLIKKAEKEGNDEIKEGIEVSPLTGSVMTTDLLEICSSNFSLMMRNKHEETKNFDSIKINASKFYVTTPKDFFSGDIVSKASFIPCAVKEKSTARANGTKLATLFKDNNETFTVYGIENGSTDIIRVVECLPKFNIDDFKPEKLGLKSKADVIKAMKNIEDKAKKAYSNVKEGLTSSGFMKKEREASSFGNITFTYGDAILRNNLNLHNVRIARLCYHCCVELYKLIK